ncbi:hypothetical protein F5Y16DRAFT_421656 [Xylariaceae sp. FL0255]|nr:hypothetical protein F5Y16DRAFT_421656 [Xylariaceae sp. FL0255]
MDSTVGQGCHQTGETHDSKCSDTPPDNSIDSDADVTTSPSGASSEFGCVGQDERPLVAIIGCGFIGRQLLAAFSTYYDVLGFDIKPERLRKANDKASRRDRKDAKKVGDPIDTETTFTNSPADLIKATHILVAVSTNLLPDNSIDTSSLQKAVKDIKRFARSGSTVVIESSVAVGMTRELFATLAKDRGLFVGMSPERVDPGRSQPVIRDVPKIVSGLDDVVPGSLEAIMKLYSKVFKKLVDVASVETAEITKLYENCQRMINIAYVNEMADACRAHNINPYEVCKAAETKPFGYMSFTPGVGVGGPCIPVNPYYLLSNSSFPLLKEATEKMHQRPLVIARRIINELVGESRTDHSSRRGDCGQNVSDHSENKASSAKLHRRPSYTAQCVIDKRHEGSDPDTSWRRINSKLPNPSPKQKRPKVLVVGIGFKAGQALLSNSPGKRLLEELWKTELLDVKWADPLVKQSSMKSSIPRVNVPRLSMKHWNKESLEKFDKIIVVLRQPRLSFGPLDELKDTKKVEMWCL